MVNFGDKLKIYVVYVGMYMILYIDGVRVNRVNGWFEVIFLFYDFYILDGWIRFYIENINNNWRIMNYFFMLYFKVNIWM